MVKHMYRERTEFRVKKGHEEKRVEKVMQDQLENVVEKVIGVIKVNKVNKKKYGKTIFFFHENIIIKIPFWKKGYLGWTLLVL